MYPNPEITDADFLYYMLKNTPIGVRQMLIGEYYGVVERDGVLNRLRIMRGNHHVAATVLSNSRLEACKRLAEQLSESLSRAASDGASVGADVEEEPEQMPPFVCTRIDYGRGRFREWPRHWGVSENQTDTWDYPELDMVKAMRTASHHFAQGFAALEGVADTLKNEAAIAIRYRATKPIHDRDLTKAEREALRVFRKMLGVE
jgi:hypothetical protein